MPSKSESEVLGHSRAAKARVESSEMGAGLGLIEAGCEAKSHDKNHSNESTQVRQLSK